MVDFLDEVNEDLRRERTEQLWKKYSPLLLSFAALVVLAVGGFKFWETQQLKATQEVAATYEKALGLIANQKSEEAVALLKPLTAQTSAYKDLSRLVLASELAKTNRQEGVKALDALAQDTALDKALRDNAAILAAHLVVDTANFDEIKTRLNGIATSPSAFRLAAKELIGLAAFKAKDAKTASELFNELKNDAQATNSLRLRSDVMLAVLAGQK